MVYAKHRESVEEGVSPLAYGIPDKFCGTVPAELSLEGWNETLLNGEVGAKESSTKFLSELGFRNESKLSMK